MSKQTVYSKSKVYEVLENFASGIRPLKTVKEVREFVDNFLPSYKPNGRGRRSGFDVKALQAVVDEVSEKLTGNDARYLACAACTAWNVKPENTTKLIESSTIKRLVLTGKLQFPEGVEFTVRPRKAKADVVSE